MSNIYMYLSPVVQRSAAYGDSCECLLDEEAKQLVHLRNVAQEERAVRRTRACADGEE